jgi:hypothetical protein
LERRSPGRAKTVFEFPEDAQGKDLLRMKLPPEAIQEFQETYKIEYGEALSDQIAQECLANLLDILRVVYKPIPKAERRNDGTRLDKDSK